MLESTSDPRRGWPEIHGLYSQVLSWTSRPNSPLETTSRIPADGRVEYLGVTLHIADAVPLDGVDHGLRLFEGHGHGFLADDVLAVFGGDDGVLGVEGVGRAHPHSVNVGALAHGLHAVEGLDAVLLAGCVQSLLPDVRDRCELHVLDCVDASEDRS